MISKEKLMVIKKAFIIILILLFNSCISSQKIETEEPEENEQVVEENTTESEELTLDKESNPIPETKIEDKAVKELPQFDINDKKLTEKDKSQMKKLERESRKYYQTGLRSYRDSDYDSAEENFLKAIELLPDYINALGSLAILYQSTEEYDQALEYYKKILLIYPEDYISHLNSGAIYLEQNRYDEAEKEYLYLIQVNKKDPEGYYGLGRTMLYKKYYTKALDYLLKAEELYELNRAERAVDAQYLAGFAFYQLDDYKNAILYFLKAYTIYENYPELNYYIGLSMILQKEKDFTNAKIYIEKAVNLGFEVPQEVLNYLEAKQ